MICHLFKLLMYRKEIMKKNKDKQLPIPLEVKASMLKFTIATIIVFLIGLGMLFSQITDNKYTLSLLLLACFLIIVGIILAFLCIKSKGQVILRIDEKGITYLPMSFGTPKGVGPVLWSDITEIDIKVVSSGKSTQRYLQVQAKNPADYQVKKTKSKLSTFNLGWSKSDNTVILAPLAMLKVKSDALLATCLTEHAKHPELTNAADIKQELTHEADTQYSDLSHKAELQHSFETASDSPINSPITFQNSDPHRQKKKTRANLIAVALIIIILIGGGLSYLKTQSKYAGLKNNTQYYMTEDKTESPDIIFSFKLYNSMRAKYPVILFATQYNQNSTLNKDNVNALKKVQNEVIQKDKIYALKQDDNKFASYSKYQIKDNIINMDLIDGAGKYLFDNVDYIKIANIKRDNQKHYNIATLYLKKDNKNKSLNVRIYSEADLNKIKAYKE